MRNSNSCNPANPSNKRNKTKNYNQCNNHNEQVKIYFPSISIQILQNALNDTPNSSKKKNQVKTKIDKHLYGETQKVIIYGTTSILEILNNQPYTIYPSDKIILTSSISVVGTGAASKQQLQQAQQPQQPQQPLQLLIDYSNMKRSHTPSYQIPYEFKIHSYVVKKYKMNPMSSTSFVIEYKDNKIYDFYVLANLSRIPLGVSTNRIEIDNFIKEDIISFLLMLNLY
jgi:hypothetical protein